MNIGHPKQLKKIKILAAVLGLPAKQHCQFGPFTKITGKIGWIGSAVLLVDPNGPQDFDFFNCHGCQTFILFEIHRYLSPKKVDIITHSLAVYFTWIALISSSGSGGSPSGTMGDIWGGELLSNFLNSGLSSKLKLPFLPLSVFSVSTTLGFGVNSEKEMYWKLKLGYEKFTDSS